MANSGKGYAYMYQNVGAMTTYSGKGYGEMYENVGVIPVNSQKGYAVNYENVIAASNSSNQKLPPTFN